MEQKTFEEILPELDEILDKRKNSWRMSFGQQCWEDFAQDMRIHIFKKFIQWNQSRPFAHWAHRIISNQLINRKRQLTDSQKAKDENYSYRLDAPLSEDQDWADILPALPDYDIEPDLQKITEHLRRDVDEGLLEPRAFDFWKRVIIGGEDAATLAGELGYKIQEGKKTSRVQDNDRVYLTGRIKQMIAYGLDAYTPPAPQETVIKKYKQGYRVILPFGGQTIQRYAGSFDEALSLKTRMEAGDIPHPKNRKRSSVSEDCLKKPTEKIKKDVTPKKAPKKATPQKATQKKARRRATPKIKEEINKSGKVWRVRFLKDKTNISRTAYSLAEAEEMARAMSEGIIPPKMDDQPGIKKRKPRRPTVQIKPYVGGVETSYRVLWGSNGKRHCTTFHDVGEAEACKRQILAEWDKNNI